MGQLPGGRVAQLPSDESFEGAGVFGIRGDETATRRCCTVFLRFLLGTEFNLRLWCILKRTLQFVLPCGEPVVGHVMEFLQGPTLWDWTVSIDQDLKNGRDVNYAEISCLVGMHARHISTLV
jgi:hypothetical protein